MEALQIKLNVGINELFYLLVFNHVFHNLLHAKIENVKVGNLDKKLGVVPRTFRNINGGDLRSDKMSKTLRKEAEKSKK